MAQRPRVGVTGNGKRWSPSWWCTRIALWLVGARAIRLSVRHSWSGESLDALIIGGGDDISPEHYGGDVNQQVRLDPERDQLEIDWIEWALEHRKPLLGICRGLQLINVVKGGSLYADIRGLRQQTYNRSGLLPTKQVKLSVNSKLAAVCRKTHLRVNSLHHQAVKNVGQDLQVVGTDLDQFTQAVESIDHAPILGVQWHPEYLFYLPTQLAIFRWLCAQGAAYQTDKA
ncbi:gamma-glutamyl-gamma-aminobutyrate hydrolase family protein [Vibrio sp. MEBiC08052]|uniref:gamma-glutamyl-gamma-aminobutyrate hydrolase family protein n=1 Tax=Vibrio sp. MEBiC08052 TaxID=1761910 RepID=UPI0007408759|nr:gamma-glutamyl-gamma-aminobutyrate hydrolase family protein [Vibrio sp. MEBiC08052]KUI97323.1 glutamine amidotransferase [Vibrio sp. MEBiC08052]